MHLRYFMLALIVHPAIALGQQVVELRAGTLVPQQVLDGAGLHLASGWRLNIAETLYLQLESGVNRVATTALVRDIDALGGTVRLRADHVLWSVPLLAGIVWQGERGGLALLGGAAWSRASLKTRVVNGAILDDLEKDVVDPLVRVRADFAWPLPVGAIIAGVGWQQVFPVERETGGDPEKGHGDIHASGLLLEVGWRAQL